MENGDKTMKVWHYTTPHRAKKIFETKDLHDSTDTTHDAFYGRGKYLSDLPPKSNDSELMKQLWTTSLSSPGGKRRQKDLRGWVELEINGNSLKRGRKGVHVYHSRNEGKIKFLGWGRR